MATRLPPPDDAAPVVDWNDFINGVFKWRQGQHVGLIGPTESGKSTLTYGILPLRKYVTFFATKPKDSTLDQFAATAGFERIEVWPPKNKWTNRPVKPEKMPRRILWPDARVLGATSRQRAVFGAAIDDIYRSGGWCVVWDEFWYMTNILELEKESRIFLQQARSNDISFVMGAQRPSRIPLEMFDQSTHLFFWRDNDESNLKRMSGIGWLSADLIRSLVARLEPHQVLYLNARTGAMYRTIAPLPPKSKPAKKGRRWL